LISVISRRRQTRRQIASALGFPADGSAAPDSWRYRLAGTGHRGFWRLALPSNIPPVGAPPDTAARHHHGCTKVRWRDVLRMIAADRNVALLEPEDNQGSSPADRPPSGANARIFPSSGVQLPVQEPLCVVQGTGCGWSFPMASGEDDRGFRCGQSGLVTTLKLVNPYRRRHLPGFGRDLGIPGGCAGGRPLDRDETGTSSQRVISNAPTSSLV
jgi:hypothetical protein